MDIQGNKVSNKEFVDLFLVRWFVYWPFYFSHILFKIVKFVCKNFRLLVIPAVVATIGLEIWLLPKYCPYNLSVLQKMSSKSEWILYMSDFFGGTYYQILDFIFGTAVVVSIILAIYIIPPAFMFYFTKGFATQFYERFNWDELDSSFDKAISAMKNGMHSGIGNLVAGIVNTLFLVFLILTILYGGGKLKDATTNYFQEESRGITEILSL